MRALRNKCFLCEWHVAKVGVTVSAFPDVPLCWYEFDHKDVLHRVEQKLSRFFMGGNANLHRQPNKSLTCENLGVVNPPPQDFGKGKTAPADGAIKSEGDYNPSTSPRS